MHLAFFLLLFGLFGLGYSVFMFHFYRVLLRLVWLCFSFSMRRLQPCFDFHLKSVWFHSPISKPVDWNMKCGFCCFMFSSYHLCSILLSFFVSGVLPWYTLGCTSLPERVGTINTRHEVMGIRGCISSLVL